MRRKMVVNNLGKALKNVSKYAGRLCMDLAFGGERLKQGGLPQDAFVKLRISDRYIFPPLP